MLRTSGGRNLIGGENRKRWHDQNCCNNDSDLQKVAPQRLKRHGKEHEQKSDGDPFALRYQFKRTSPKQNQPDHKNNNEVER